jgi:hypothetical protein
VRVRAAVSVHPGVHDPQLDALQFGEHADGGSALQEIGDHLHGHFARIGADTALRNTVVRSKHDSRWLNDAYAEGSLNRAHLRGKRLEPAKSAARLRQPVQAAVRFGANGLVNGGS